MEVYVDINAPMAKVWHTICDIEHSASNISGIDEIEVLEQPTTDGSIVGLKWKETRIMFGKEATETMWIIDAVENDYYKVQAESCGCQYISIMRVSEVEEAGGSTATAATTRLTMSHETIPQTFIAKLLNLPMGWLMKGYMEEMIKKDLEDIKAKVEEGEQPSQ